MTVEPAPRSSRCGPSPRADRVVRCRDAVGGAADGPAARSALLRVRALGSAAVADERVLADLDPFVATLLRLARDQGAAVGPVLEAATAAADQRRLTAAEVAAAIAPARTVARSLVSMPVVAVPILGAVAGADLVGFYLRDPLGRVLGVVVLVLLGVAAAWMRVLLAADGSRSTSPRAAWALAALGAVVAVIGPVVPGVALVAVGLVRARSAGEPAGPSPHLAVVADLAAVALAAGHDLAGALRMAADHLPSAVPHARSDVAPLVVAVRVLALELVLRPVSRGDVEPTDQDPTIAPLAAAVRALAAAGAPGVEVLRGLARRLRDDDARRGREAAARLPARLTFPTALVLVPATVLAIGAPIVLQGLAALTST